MRIGLNLITEVIPCEVILLDFMGPWEAHFSASEMKRGWIRMLNVPLWALQGERGLPGPPGLPGLEGLKGEEVGERMTSHFEGSLSRVCV